MPKSFSEKKKEGEKKQIMKTKAFTYVTNDYH